MVCSHLHDDTAAKEQTEPGPEWQVAAAEGQSKQEEFGGGNNGQAAGRAAAAALEEEGSPSAEREPACEFMLEMILFTHYLI